MNERLEATIICCAKLTDGVTPLEKARDFADKVQRATGLTNSGMDNNQSIRCIIEQLYDHGNVDAALRKAGL